MTIEELLDQAKNRANLHSDYALAKAIGVNTGVVSNWRKGKQHPSNDEAVQLATLAGLEEMNVIGQIELMTAKNEKKREFWRNFLERRGVVATLSITGLALSIAIAPEPSEAAILHLQNYDAKICPADEGNIHYAQYS